jgi:hypothetical protein
VTGHIRRLATVSGIGVITLGAMLLAGGRPAPTGMRIAPRRHAPIRIHQRRDNGQYESTNWAGYAVTGNKGSVTDVKGSWRVPAVTCSSTPNGYSSYWVGIDGWTSSTVEQIGTDSDCVSLSGTKDTPTYYAWFEFYPNPAYVIEFPEAVMPGDTISAEVSVAGTTSNGPRGNAASAGTKFTVTLTDVTTGYTFTTSTSVSKAEQTSAEWIVEAPCCGTKNQVLPLALFGTVDLGGDWTGQAGGAATVNGTSGAISSFGANVQESVMVSESNPAVAKAEPSALSTDGTSFTVTWASPGP